MPKIDEVEDYKDYKHRRLQLIQAIDRNENQINFHQAQLVALKELMMELDQKHEGYQSTARREQAKENQRSIQEVADYLARDKKQVEKRVQDRKAKKLLEHMMKGFK